MDRGVASCRLHDQVGAITVDEAVPTFFDAHVKAYAEIRRTIAEDLGFTDLATYKTWVDTVRPKIKVITKEMIDRLSPDDVNCRDFWRVCDELFGVDPVCNVVKPPEVGNMPYAVETTMDANRLNLRLAKSMGITSFLDEFAHERVRTLEIGPGYGSLKHYIETHTNHRYLAFDVVPRIPDVRETTEQGFLPDDFVTEFRGQYSYVVSTNVFQHLSAKQRTRYFHQIHDLLHDGGVFLFNMLVDTGKAPQRDKNGNAWADHYGQYTLIPKVGDIQKQITSLYFILFAIQRYDGLFTFVVQKRK